MTVYKAETKYDTDIAQENILGVIFSELHNFHMQNIHRILVGTIVVCLGGFCIKNVGSG